MSKKLFWIFLIIGICWIAGVSYWYLGRVANLDFGSIKWDENFTSKDPATQAFFNIILLAIVPLLVTALIFYCIGLFFGKKTEEILYKVEKENQDLKNELVQQVDKVETMKVLYTGGKIEKRKKGTDETVKYFEKRKTEETPKNILPVNDQRDDLKIIEGIGERIEFFLNENGIFTWTQLSRTSEEKLKDILLIYGGPSYKIHNPSSWPKQADLAAQRKWDELNALKENIRKN